MKLTVFILLVLLALLQYRLWFSPGGYFDAKDLRADLGISKDTLNIKATTNEKMGYIGNREGIAVHAVAALGYGGAGMTNEEKCRKDE